MFHTGRMSEFSHTVAGAGISQHITCMTLSGVTLTRFLARKAMWCTCCTMPSQSCYTLSQSIYSLKKKRNFKLT